MIYYSDRSGSELRRKCPRAFFWNRLAGPSERGIVLKEEAAALRIGGETHEDFRVLAETDDISPEGIDELIEPLVFKAQKVDVFEQRKLEELYRRIGWLTAYALFLEPTVREEFEDIAIENEIAFQARPDYIIGVTPDRLLRHRESGVRVYREYKTTITASRGWLESWHYKPQVHLGLKSAAELLGGGSSYAQIVGLLKGEIRDGRLSSPLVYAWKKIDGENISENWRFDYAEARSGFVATGAWEYPGSYVEFVQRVGREKAEGVFPHTEPIFLSEKLLEEYISEEYLRAVEATREGPACRGDEARRGVVFPKNTDACRPIFGDPCPYRAACWNSSVNENPIASGLYVERVPHHEVEGVVFLSNREG